MILQIIHLENLNTMLYSECSEKSTTVTKSLYRSKFPTHSALPSSPARVDLYIEYTQNTTDVKKIGSIYTLENTVDPES